MSGQRTITRNIRILTVSYIAVVLIRIWCGTVETESEIANLEVRNLEPVVVHGCGDPLILSVSQSGEGWGYVAGTAKPVFFANGENFEVKALNGPPKGRWRLEIYPDKKTE